MLACAALTDVAITEIPFAGPPTTTLPPAGGGKRKKPVQPIWDRERESRILQGLTYKSTPPAPATPGPVAVVEKRHFAGFDTTLLEDALGLSPRVAHAVAADVDRGAAGAGLGAVATALATDVDDTANSSSSAIVSAVGMTSERDRGLVRAYAVDRAVAQDAIEDRADISADAIISAVGMASEKDRATSEAHTDDDDLVLTLLEQFEGTRH